MSIINTETLQEHWAHFTICSFVYFFFPSNVSCLYLLKSSTSWVFSITINLTIIYPTAWTESMYKSFLIFFFSFLNIWRHCSGLGYQYRLSRLLQENYYLYLFSCSSAIEHLQFICTQQPDWSFLKYTYTSETHTQTDSKEIKESPFPCVLCPSFSDLLVKETKSQRT